MGLGFYLSVAMLPVMVILTIIFLCKKKVNNEETKIYRFILITSILMTFLEILSAILYQNYLNTFIYIVVAKLVLVSYIIVNYLFCNYLMIVCRRRKLAFNVLRIVSIIVLLLTVFTITEYVETNGSVAPQGLPIILTFGYAIFLGIYQLILTIINRKTITIKKFTPFYLFLAFGAINASIIYFYPTSFMVGYIWCLTIIIMNFTIENPDVKMMKEVELAKEAADKANRAKTDFLSSMSHEIRTPLNAIVGFSDCIMDAKNLGEAQENAKDIVNASQTLLEIVNGILDISKIEAGKIEIVNSKYNAPETFLELAKLITPKMNEKGLEFTYNIAPDLPTTLFGDHANIKKIVTNLLSNACKYTDRGYVHYEVNCVNSGNVSKLIISVEDSGRGIKKDSVDKMFTKFQRLDEDRNTTIEGTGLGLAITKQLIELMGGRIIVHTVYGEGSKFTVVLNQKITTSDVVTSKKVKTTLDLNNVKILMVDDTPLNLKVASKLLEKYNANQIVTCDSGFECLDRISRGEVYDVILLDDMMPKMSGVETLKKLKEIPGFNIPTVALTANAITGMREKYLADGFNDYLAKPIEKEQLIQVLNQILGRSATEDINTFEVNKANENIRSEEIPDVEGQVKAEEERKNDIIPVEDNIEEVLGDKLDRNYEEKTMSDMKPIKVDHIDSVEILDEEPKLVSSEDLKVETIPVVDIGPIPEVANVPNLYDREYLESNGVDVDHALELLGDMDMYNMTISDFMKDVEAKWNKIVEYKNSGNMPDYAIEVHSLKSDCKYLGFMKLADISYQHELKSKDNDLDFVNNNFEELESEYKKVLAIAREYVEHNKIEG